MCEGKLNREVEHQYYEDEGSVSVTKDNIKDVIDEAKQKFPVKYAYDAWEMPETNKDKEKKICEIIKWYITYFGK